MRHVFPLVILWIGALMAVPALAQQMDAEEPVEEVFQAELVYPQEHGALQLSLAPWFTSITHQQTGQTSFTVEYGLTDAWQVEVEWHGFGYGAARASETLEVGTKYSLLNVFGSTLHLAVGSELEVPVRGEEASVELEPYVILAHDFPRLAGLHVFAQAAAGFAFGSSKDDILAEEEEESAWNAHLGAFLPTNLAIFTAELNGFHQEEGTLFYATPGVVWDLPGNWQIGLGVPIGLTDGADRFRLVGLLTYEFEFFNDD